MRTQENELALLQHALKVLHKTTGITGQVFKQQMIVQGIRVDARVGIEANGQHYDYLAEIKRIDRFATLGDIKNQYGQFGDELLLVAYRVTTEIAEKCRELDLQFIDTAGNAYLRGPGLFVLVKGLRPIEREDFQLAEQEGKRAGTATNLRVFFALLCKPELLNAPYRDINQTAGVALGAVLSLIHISE